MKEIFLKIWGKLKKEPRKEKPARINVVIRWVSDGDRMAPDQPPPHVEEQFVAHHFGPKEPSGAWQIE